MGGRIRSLRMTPEAWQLQGLFAQRIHSNLAKLASAQTNPKTQIQQQVEKNVWVHLVYPVDYSQKLV